MSVRMLPAAVAARLRAEAGQDFCGPPGRIDLCVRVSRDRQRRAALFHASRISPGAVLWRGSGCSANGSTCAGSYRPGQARERKSRSS